MIFIQGQCSFKAIVEEIDLKYEISKDITFIFILIETKFKYHLLRFQKHFNHFNFVLRTEY